MKTELLGEVVPNASWEGDLLVYQEKTIWGQTGGKHDAVDIQVGVPDLLPLLISVQPILFNGFRQREEWSHPGKRVVNGNQGKVGWMLLQQGIDSLDGVKADRKAQLSKGKAVSSPSRVLKAGVASEAGNGLLKEKRKAFPLWKGLQRNELCETMDDEGDAPLARRALSVRRFRTCCTSQC